MLRVASLVAVLSCAFAWTPAGLSLRIDGGRPLISSYGGLRASSAAVMKSKDELRAEEIAAAKKELAEAIAAKAAAKGGSVSGSTKGGVSRVGCSKRSP